LKEVLCYHAAAYFGLIFIGRRQAC